MYLLQATSKVTAKRFLILVPGLGEDTRTPCSFTQAMNEPWMCCGQLAAAKEAVERMERQV